MAKTDATKPETTTKRADNVAWLGNDGGLNLGYTDLGIFETKTPTPIVFGDDSHDLDPPIELPKGRWTWSPGFTKHGPCLSFLEVDTSESLTTHLVKKGEKHQVKPMRVEPKPESQSSDTPASQTNRRG